MVSMSKSPSHFRRRAESAFRRANPDAVAVGIVIDWLRCVRVTWADGTPGFSGTMLIVSPGHRTRTMIATETDSAISVR